MGVTNFDEIALSGTTVTGVVKQNHVADVTAAATLNATYSNTETAAAINAVATKVNAVIAAIEAAGVLKSS